MRPLDLSYYEPIFSPLQGLRVGLVDGFGNTGDYLIYAATRQLLDAFEIDWIPQTVKDKDPVEKLLLFGGGSMGSWYVRDLLIRRRALKRNIPAILLPQSFMRPEDRPFEKIFVRDRPSQRLCPKGILAPDLALGYDYTPPSTPPPNDRGIFLRLDREAKWPIKSLLRSNENLGDPMRGITGFNEYLNLASQYQHIVTDRLHFAICGLLNQRKVTLLPGNWHKNKGIWELWLKGIGCEWADSPEELKG